MSGDHKDDCDLGSQKNKAPLHTDQLPRLARIAGQIEGIKKMIEEQRPCPEIITQIRATRSAMKAVKANIFARHLTHCVCDTMSASSEDERMKHADELVKVFKSFED